MKTGKIIPNGVVLEKHEMMTVIFLTDVTLIPKSNKQDERSPDIELEKLFEHSKQL